MRTHLKTLLKYLFNHEFALNIHLWDFRKCFRISCTVSFGSGRHVGSYAAVCTALNVAMTQTTRVARDMIRTQTRHSRTAARIDGRLDNSTELHTWTAASTHFRGLSKCLVQTTTLSIIYTHIAQYCGFLNVFNPLALEMDI